VSCPHCGVSAFWQCPSLLPDYGLRQLAASSYQECCSPCFRHCTFFGDSAVKTPTITTSAHVVLQHFFYFYDLSFHLNEGECQADTWSKVSLFSSYCLDTPEAKSNGYDCSLPHDAMLARYMYMSWPCVRLSVTSWSSAKQINESSWVLARELFPPFLHCVIRKFWYL